jgi:hypothetical protein
MRLAPGSASRREVLVVLVVLSRRFLLYICRWAIYLVSSDRDGSWLLEELFASVSSPLPGVGQVFEVSRSGCLRSCFCDRFGPSVVEIDISGIGSRSSIDWWYFQMMGVCFEF